MRQTGAIFRIEPGGTVLTTKEPIDDIASRIDVGLCDACGDIRMRDSIHEDDDLPGVVLAERLSQVRRDIAEMVMENRTSFAELDRRLQSVAQKVADIQVERAREDGKLTGVKTTLGVIITISGLLGGLIAWVISHLPWGTPKP